MVIKMVTVQKISGQLQHKIVNEAVTSAYDDVGMKCDRDAFDTLFDHAPDKLQVVKKVRNFLLKCFFCLLCFWTPTTFVCSE